MSPLPFVQISRLQIGRRAPVYKGAFAIVMSLGAAHATERHSSYAA